MIARYDKRNRQKMIEGTSFIQIGLRPWSSAANGSFSKVALPDGLSGLISSDLEASGLSNGPLDENCLTGVSGAIPACSEDPSPEGSSDTLTFPGTSTSLQGTDIFNFFSQCSDRSSDEESEDSLLVNICCRIERNLKEIMRLTYKESRARRIQMHELLSRQYKHHEEPSFACTLNHLHPVCFSLLSCYKRYMITVITTPKQKRS